MGKTANSKNGKYVCNIGYLQIRQKLYFKKQSEVFVVHKKNSIAGPFKSIEIAKQEAMRCINEGIKFSKYK